MVQMMKTGPRHTEKCPKSHIKRSTDGLERTSQLPVHCSSFSSARGLLWMAMGLLLGLIINATAQHSLRQPRLNLTPASPTQTFPRIPPLLYFPLLMSSIHLTLCDTVYHSFMINLFPPTPPHLTLPSI